MIVLINGTERRHKPGIVLHEKLSEELDTGLLILPQTEELTLEPMDKVSISRVSPLFSKKMLISDILRTTTKFTGTKHYTYTLGLISPTIQLQRIVLPNRSITQPLTGTKTDIYTVLSQYVSMYSSFTISSALQTLTTGVDCPEFQWNRPTLFEVCNDLLSEVDAVVTFTTGSFTQISYLNLNPDGDEITDDFAEAELTQSIQDYANKIECEAENAVINGQNISTMQWYALKTTQDAIVTDENAELILEKPIYKINKLIARINPDLTTAVYEADLTDWIVEKTKYDQLYTSISTSYPSGDYKRDKLFYTEGSNVIEGFCYSEDTFLSISSKKAINNVFRNAYLAQESTDIGSILNNSEVLRYVFKVDYQAIETVKFTTSKDGLGHDSTLINNQSTSYVDYISFANKQQQTVNRLGNSTLTLMGKVTTLPALGDYTGDYKLAEREYVIYDDYFNFKGVCAKNYVLRNLYTGLKQERRYTKIATDKDAFECNHLIELEFNLSKTDASASATLENYLLKVGEANENIRVVDFITNTMSDHVGVAPSVYYSNNAIQLTYKMADNFSTGVSIDTTLNYTGTRAGLNYVSYVNSIGNYASHTMKLYKSLDVSYLDISPQPSTSTWIAGVKEIREFPLIDTGNLNDLVYQAQYTRYKDNREITVETLQFKFKHDDDVFYGKKFFSNNPLTYIGTTDDTLKVAYSTTATYEDGDQTYEGTIADSAHLTYTKYDNYIYITSPDSSIDINDLTSWAIVDTSGNIYIAVNGNDNIVYLNKEA